MKILIEINDEFITQWGAIVVEPFEPGHETNEKPIKSASIPGFKFSPDDSKAFIVRVINDRNPEKEIENPSKP